MKTLIKSRKNEVGATAIEYGLIAALISVVIIGAVSTVGGNLKTTFNTIGTTIGETSTAG
ncbi:MAG: Flp family type IVb pilin [Acetobacter fabarum]|jgi:pilus assembly protein Flp/PilA|uniref:Flp family type IVb pilin n=1 Tax=Acetobacter fabarum TaxID=483199 RepID=UPI00242B728C|nr:Flp family type IVb pilin [Acetobacter fabarum]MCH4024856.1 Flp family type IVb pilin [Acetobacter fabarum]MCI1298167.1 Flp family type IVb pilin [Acetobacter fabarum]MCI1420154.1 Flp family type IVb pilin [Acetobacter fabarum]MCI1446916.1 Flp family type IVb pilin [Acetobacter fabarum]MCI1465602.1 Flp family type IVb pilin [Acetobacter fabarum]